MVFRDRIVLRTRVGGAYHTVGAFGAGKNHPRHVAHHRRLEYVEGSAEVDVEYQLGIGPPLRITDQRRKVHDSYRLARVDQPRQQRAITNVTHQQFVLAAQVGHKRIVGGVVERRYLETAREQVAYHPASIDATATSDEYLCAHW